MNGSDFLQNIEKAALGRATKANCINIPDNIDKIVATKEGGELVAPKRVASLKTLPGNPDIYLKIDVVDHVLAFTLTPNLKDTNETAKASPGEALQQYIPGARQVCVSEDAQTVVWVTNRKRLATMERVEDLVQGYDIIWFAKAGKPHVLSDQWVNYYAPRPKVETADIPCITDFIPPDDNGLSGLVYYEVTGPSCPSERSEQKKSMLRYPTQTHFLPVKEPPSNMEKCGSAISQDDWKNMSSITPQDLQPDRAISACVNGGVTLRFYRHSDGYVQVNISRENESTPSIIAILPINIDSPPKSIGLEGTKLIIQDADDHYYYLNIDLENSKAMLGSLKIESKGKLTDACLMLGSCQ